MKSSIKFHTIHKVTLSSNGSTIQLPRKIRVRNVPDKLEQEFEILCAFARLIDLLGPDGITEEYEENDDIYVGY